MYGKTTREFIYEALRFFNLHKMAEHALVETNEDLLRIYVTILKMKLRAQHNPNKCVLGEMYNLDLVTRDEVDGILTKTYPKTVYVVEDLPCPF